jgi:hypothetical protein
MQIKTSWDTISYLDDWKKSKHSITDFVDYAGEVGIFIIAGGKAKLYSSGGKLGNI